MVVSHDKKTAIVAHYKTLNEVNAPYRRLKLKGLDNDGLYNGFICGITPLIA